MEILAVIIFVVIVFTIVFVAKTYHWLFKKQDEYSPIRALMPEPMIRTFNMEELYYNFVYTKERDRNFLTFDPRTPYMLDDRLAHEKKRVAEKMGRELLNNGLIEVKERQSLHNPFMNEVEMRLRVYKEDAVSKAYQRGFDEANEANAIMYDPNW